MGKGVRSARGAIVDFDLLRIKEQIASSPKTTNVQAREDFIDKKLNRRLKKLSREAALTAPVIATPAPVVESVVQPETEQVEVKKAKVKINAPVDNKSE